jgi:hypothetical protein
MILYLDMDGVLADFFGAFAKKMGKDHWKLIEDKEKGLDALKHTDFFNTLEPFDSAKDLVAYARAYGDWGINSSPLRGDHDNSKFWKRMWLMKHDFMPSVENLVFTGSKERFAVDRIDGSPNVLVDDKPSNINRWVDRGGIGVLYQANQDSFEELRGKLDRIFLYPHKNRLSD